MARPASHGWLFGGPGPSAGAESLVAHRVRLGEMPPPQARAAVIDDLERSGLLGRGGAGFPVGRKWRSLAGRGSNGAVVIANGAEGEPRSLKDRTLMALRPHLVIDGAELAADAVGADEVILYVGTEHRPAVLALERALMERTAVRPPGRSRVTLVKAPPGYVSGESSAAVRYIDHRDARPTTSPPSPRERGVGARPTLVQNVESLAHAALIARFGDTAFRSMGHASARGSALVTVTGTVAAPGVREIAYGTTLRELAWLAGGLVGDAQAVLLGGYFGGWGALPDLWDVPLDPPHLASAGLGFGCGLVALLAAEDCGVVATARIVDYMAGESARQCGPCIFGLGAMAGATRRLATAVPTETDLHDITRWSARMAGRGACHHPDGAAALLMSGLRVFGDEFALHQARRRCSRPASLALPA